MKRLKIASLGPLQISMGDKPLLGFLSDKVRALLVYLAVEQDRPWRREHLAGLLWPEKSSHKARANLRRALANLRKVINDEEGNFLIITRQTLRFNPESNAFVDLVQFLKILEEREPHLSKLEEAVQLSRGPFLHGFSINDSVIFEEWALLKREENLRRLMGILNRLTTYYEGFHQPEKALSYAWHQINLEPWDERPHRQIMSLLAAAGQHKRAQSHYEQLKLDLKSELGILPEQETINLYRKIIKGDFDAKTAEAYPPFLDEPQTIWSVRFVAREDEMLTLAKSFQKASAGERQCVLVSGEAGSGKTSLLRNFSYEIQREFSDAITLFGGCKMRSGPREPYLPFRQILAQLLGDLEPEWHNGLLNREQICRLWFLRQEAADLLMQTGADLLSLWVDSKSLPLAIPFAKSSSPASPQILYQQATHFLQKLSRFGPILLVLEDLHWGEQEIFDLLAHLLPHTAGYPICIVASYRPEEVLLEHQVEEDRHPFARLLYEIKLAGCEVEVSLNNTDGRRFIDAWLDTEPNRLDDIFRHTLFEKTQGHALFTIELIKDLQERGYLKQDKDHQWCVADSISWDSLPLKTEAIIAERISRLLPDQRLLLKAAAIQGETFTADVVAKLLNWPLQKVIYSFSRRLARTCHLIRAERRKQIGTKALSYYKFRHNLFQQFIYHRLDPVERSFLHLQTANILEAFYLEAGIEKESGAAILAYHFEAAQAIKKAMTYRELAGQYALKLSAYSDVKGQRTASHRPYEYDRSTQQQLSRRIL